MDAYEHYKAEILQGQPYALHNEALAKGIFTDAKKQHPAASLFYHHDTQYICLDDAARRALAASLKKEHKRRADDLQQLEDLIQKVEGL